jgi:RNA-binding protein
MTENILPVTPLPGKSVRELRAKAHSLKPVVWISSNGATATVLREIDRALRAHELIKIHAAVDGRDERTTLMEEICNAVGAASVQIIGKMLVVYRSNPQEPEPAPAARKPARSTRTRASDAGPGRKSPAGAKHPRRGNAAGNKSRR